MQVQQIFTHYLESKREFLATAERCWIKGWPERKVAIQDSFELQHLFSDREAVRFAYLMRDNSSVLGLCKSLQEISDRLDKNWELSEEDALRAHDASYSRLEQEIAVRQSIPNSEALEGPLRDVQKDPEYMSARIKIYERIRELDRYLATQNPEPQ